MKEKRVTIMSVSEKVLTTLYNYFRKENAKAFLAHDEISNRLGDGLSDQDIEAGIRYLIGKELILEKTSGKAFQITPKGIEHYEGELDHADEKQSKVIINGDANINTRKEVSHNVILNLGQSKLSKTQKRRIFNILTEVGEMITFLKKKDLLSQKNEKKFKEWFGELESIIQFHDLEEDPSKLNEEKL